MELNFYNRAYLGAFDLFVGLDKTDCLMQLKQRHGVVEPVGG